MVASLVSGFAVAQVPAAPPGGTKPVSKKKADRVAERAKSMRNSITKGRQVKAHVKVMVRLKNGNRLRGVVKDGRLVERVDGLRFVDAQARDTGAGIRLWYSGGTRSYIFIPFVSLKTYEVVQRLSQKQLMDIEAEMQMAERRAKERAAKQARRARGEATGDVSGTAPAPETVPVQGGAPKLEHLQQVPGFGKLPGQQPTAGAQAGEPGAAQPATEEPSPDKVAKARTSRRGKGKVAKGKGQKDKADAAKTGEGDGELAQAKKELLWANLLRTYPPKDGWNEAKKNEIERRPVVIGAQPSEIEKKFVEQFDEWMQACEHNGVDPNAGVVQKPKTRREQRLERRRRTRGR